MKMKYLLIALLLINTGCASIVSDSDYAVTIDADDHQEYTIKNEDGFRVFKGNGHRVVMLSAGGGYNCDDHIITTACGDIPLKSSVDPWVFGNLLFGGIIGAFIVDPMTGAACKLPKYTTVSSCSIIGEK